jgi:plasmid stabilization system protein ParE
LPRIEFASGVVEDFERVQAHLAAHDSEASPLERIAEIRQALRVLTHSPSIGRPAGRGQRELVIGRDAHGYVVLYRYISTLDTVVVLAMRHQRESGYAR